MLVTVVPGATAFTRTPNGASSEAAERVNPITPCLAVVYACGPRPPITPAVLATERMQPLRCLAMTRPACLMP